MLDYKITLTDARKTAGQNWPKPGSSAHLIEERLNIVMEQMTPEEMSMRIVPTDTIRTPRKYSTSNSGDYAERIKEAVSTREAARHYGIEVDLRGFGRCPFHREKTASFYIYPQQNRGWCCFGCRAGGDVIQLVRLLFDLSFQDAMAKLNEDFHIGLPIGQRLTPMQRVIAGHKAMEKIQQRRLFDEAIDKTEAEYWKAFNRWHVFDTIVRFCAPTRPVSLDDATLEELDFDPWYAAALQLLPEAEYDLEQAEIRLYEMERYHERPSR